MYTIQLKHNVNIALLIIALLIIVSNIMGCVTNEQPLSIPPPLVIDPKPKNKNQRIALVIGNSDYMNVPKLKNTATDANDIADALQSLGFTVSKQINVTDSRTMRILVANFGEQLRISGGIGLFYYSGHGVQIKGENYLIPITANLNNEMDVDYETIGMNYVQEVMENAKNNLNFIILDACRNNPFVQKLSRTIGSNSSVSRGLAQMSSTSENNASGSLIAFATAPGRTAEDGSGKNGTYTKHLLANIRTSGLSIEDLFKKVRIGVKKETNNQQIPWEVSSLTDKFCFAGCKPTNHIEVPQLLPNIIQDNEKVDGRNILPKPLPNPHPLPKIRWRRGTF